MADPDSPEAWAEIEAKELRLWVSLAETGLWCPTCLLPSGFLMKVNRDPASDDGTRMWGCADDPKHRPAAA